ncbi:unnamed protein product [Symbiodinium sp. CCMP2592]|nr:unnamed protein product [Symbiodinium sp. CCMP2592]
MALPTPLKQFLRGWGSTTRKRMQAAARDVLESNGLQLSQPPAQALGSDCCGMSAEVLAMRELGFQHSVVFASDICEGAGSFCRANAPAGSFFGDVLARKASALAHMRIHGYFAGFPCQPWSRMRRKGGRRRRGWSDPRARVFVACLQAVAQTQPLYAILENVQGIMCFWASVSAKVQAMLPGYRLGRGLRRPRVFILCLREDSLMVGCWRTTKALVAAMLGSVAEQKMQQPLSMFLLPSASAKGAAKQMKKPVVARAQASRKTTATAKWILKHREAQRKAGKLPPLRKLSFLTAREAEVLQLAEAKLGQDKGR